MNLNVKISLNENIIRAESIINESERNAVGSGYRYAFYIYWYPNQKAKKELVYEGRYGKENTFEFKADKSGYYYARCFVERVNLNIPDPKSRTEKNTDTVLYLDSSMRNDFETILKKDLRTDKTFDGKLPFYRVHYPQNDFCLVSVKKDTDLKINKEGLKKWCAENKFLIDKIDRPSEWNTENIIIYTNNKGEVGAQSGKRENYIFSGYTWVDETFCFGQEDIPENVKSQDIYDQVGSYTMFSIEPNALKVTQDYYGWGGLYCYKTDSLLIATNTYHILMFILSFMGQPISIDEEHLYTMFATNVTMFRQSLTEELIIKNTFKLNMLNDILIERDGWKFVKRFSYAVLNSPIKYEEEEYAKAILDAKQEIIKQAKAVFENTRFKKFVLELSGGKDSRTTLAALTNLQDYDKKIKIYSIEHEPNDLNTAVGIVNMLGLKWYDDGYHFVIDDLLENIKRRRSCFAGMRYLWQPAVRHEYDLSKLVFNTESFESLCVHYYYDTVKNLVDDTVSEEELIDAYSGLCSRQAILNYSVVADIVKQNIKRGLAGAAGTTPLEKFDNFFMFYRGGVHAGNMDRMYYTSATCNILQNKSLLKAKRMWFHNFKENKIIFDMTYALNPVLAALPYNNSKLNDAYKIMKENNSLFYDDERFRNLNLKTDTDKTEYYEAEKRRTANTVVEKDANYRDRGDVKDVLFENCLLGIQRLSEIMDGKYKYTICLPLYYYINAEKDDAVEVGLIHNKVYSVLDCLDALGGDKVE